MDVMTQSQPTGRFALRRAAAVLMTVVLAMATVVGLLTQRRLAGSRDAAVSMYRYRFAREPRGAVRQTLQHEIAFYQGRIAREPHDGLDLAALGGTYLKMAKATGDVTWFLLAEQAGQRSLANLPFHNSGALMVLARVAEARHNFHEAIELAAQIWSEDALGILVTSNLAAGNVVEATRAAEVLVSRTPSLVGYTLRALVEVARGQDDRALADFHRAIASEEPGEAGSSAWARTLLGRLHYQRGEHDLAEALYREALRILPQYPLALVNLAELKIRQGKYALAEQLLTQVVTITKASPNVYDHVLLRGLARIRELRGDLSPAQQMWDEAEARLRQDVASGQFGHRRELARLLLERHRARDLPEALSLMEAELHVRRDAETLDIYAWALSSVGRWSQAREVMRQAFDSGVRDARFFYRAGVIEQALGNHREAQQFFRVATQTDPTFNEHARRVLALRDR